jgi:hypothetical protein
MKLTASKKCPNVRNLDLEEVTLKNRSGKAVSQNQGKSNQDPAAVQKKKEEKVIAALDVPPGSRFKGYQDYHVQELELIAKDVTYRMEVWLTPDGKTIRATLPTHLTQKMSK